MEQRGPTLWQTREHLNASRITPPTTAIPRLVSDPLPAGKFVWILHPCHGDIVVAQGKTGVGWKSKSKLGTHCIPGQQ
jgi:hypothetical protein